MAYTVLQTYELAISHFILNWSYESPENFITEK